MKIAALVARILLGLVFVLFGLNGFLRFLPDPGLPPGAAGQFVGALFASHYIYLVSGVQVLAGALLLINRYSVLGLTLLGPVIVNILAFHILLSSTGWPVAVFVALLWCVAAWHYRRHFAGLFVRRAE
jgi:putative oxidoreductase